MRKEIKQEDLDKIFSAFENVLKEFEMDDLHLTSFTLKGMPEPPQEDAEFADSGVVKRRLVRKTVKNTFFFKKGRKCYERRCTEDKYGIIRCRDVEVDCNKLGE